ncbi:hypothetical protein JR316_0011647 [Psilocybe cubensis]|uniref:Uncharacterized protein n=1 Tax=Psilocybe cubensis TaxID=181762 RepID=A0ACB8GL10_PSICU|nr:hypothetical protein JR316_0011647 [Psilocybe cubensis]KAH9476077.1 hypothetical protein JR316_0011647 [Psilocybe cubensis]
MARFEFEVSPPPKLPVILMRINFDHASHLESNSANSGNHADDSSESSSSSLLTDKESIHPETPEESGALEVQVQQEEPVVNPVGPSEQLQQRPTQELQQRPTQEPRVPSPAISVVDQPQGLRIREWVGQRSQNNGTPSSDV